MPGATLPLAEPASHYVLIELATPREGAELRDHELMDAVNAVVRDLDGSFSAEHAELQLMRKIKAALDPQGLLNPDKLLP
jgi:FAD/FMN-containing dehydrogenase